MLNGRNEALRKALDAKGHDSEEKRDKFARSIGVNPRTLRNWIADLKVRPHPEFQKKAARKLEVSAEELWPRG